MSLSRLLKSSDVELAAELQLILNAVVEGLCGVDAAGNVTFCNDALLKMTGFQAEDLVGKNLHQVLHHSRPDGTNYPAEECPISKSTVPGQAVHVVGEFLWRKDGTCFPTEFWVHPLQRPSSLTVRVLTIQDISETKRAEDVLHESRERFRRILASLPDVTWTLDRYGRAVYISPNVEAVFGYTPHEMYAGAAQLWLGRIHPEDFGRVKQAYTDLFENQSAFDVDFRIRRKDGTWIWVHDRAVRTHEENGVLYADGILSDITRRKRAEAELQSKTAFLEAQANSAIDGILVVDGRGQRLLLNQRLVELFKIPPEIVANEDDRYLLEYVTSRIKDPESFVAGVKHLNQNPSETSRDEIEFKDGMVFDRYSSPVIDTTGIYYGRVWTFRDITERKRNEDVLQQLSVAVEQSSVSVVITDPQGRISYVNRKFTECTGYTRDEAIGKTPRILKSGLTPPEVYQDLWATIKKGHEWRGEFSNKKKNGEIYWEAATITPIANAKGEITHYLAIKEDTTERRRVEKELQLTQFSLDHASDAVHWMNSQGRIVYVNQAFCRSVGRSREELLSLSISEIDPLLPQEAWEPVWEKLKRLGSMTFETQHQTKEGRAFPVEVTANYIEFDGKEYSFCSARDITERKRAEEAVRESNEKVKLVLDSIPEAVYGIDVQGNCTFCNPSCLRLLGYQDAADLHGKNMHALIHHTRRDGTSYPVEECHIYEAYRRGHGTHIDNEVIWRRDGSSFSAEYWSHPIHRSGEVIGTVVTFVDISERKRAEEELYASRQMLQSILDAIPQRVFWKDRNSMFLGCNRALATDAGLDTPAEIVGKSDFDLAWAGSAELYRADDKLIMEQGSAKLNFEERQSRPDGSELWLQTNKLPLRDRDGQVTGVIGTYEDITERKRVERELRLTQFSLAEASDGVFWIDSQARIVYANEAACRSLGYSREELLRLSIPDIDPLFPKEIWPEFWEKSKTRGSTNLETQHKTKEGRVFPVEVVANYLEFDGQAFSFAFARDITERRALESQLRQAQKLEGIGQLAAGIAHEINTPTQFVTDNLTFLRDSWKGVYELLELYRSTIRDAAETLPPGVAADLQQAEQNCDLDFIASEVPHSIDHGLDGARRVAEIVLAMKRFSHPDTASKTSTDLNQAIQSTITVGRSEWKYVAEMTTEFDENLPPVLCYPGDINQVVLNLVVNAAHAIKETVKDGELGRITVRTRTQGEFAEISITDTGTGIPEAIRTRIFDPFFTTKEVGKGTGQGLALAHSVIVKKHAGKIWFETEMGRGTTFFIDLPIDKADLPKQN